jgi:hypothetical protein
MALPSEISDVIASSATGATVRSRPAPTSETLFAARHVPLLETPAPFIQPPFVPCNPSVLYDEASKKWLCAIRAVDYRLGVPNIHASSQNYLAQLADDLSIRSVLPLVDASGSPKNDLAKNRGFEDLRLYMAYGDELRALATACDLAGGGLQPEMVQLHITGSRITRCLPLRGPWSRHAQKNWTVVADGNGNTVLYRALPTLAMQPAEHAKAWLEGRSLDPMEYLTSNVRGSSQAIAFDGGWLTIIHEHASKSPLTYHHRFLWLDAKLEPQRHSRAFVWQRLGVEFCAGLAYDGRRLVASYGVHDKEAWLADLDVNRVAESLTPLGVTTGLVDRSRR